VDAGNRWRDLCQARYGGLAPVDQVIADLQKRTQAGSELLDNLALLGRAWVRKARETADPVYYLNADACAQDILDASPGNPGALELRGLLLLSEHKFEPARALMQDLVDRKPNDVVGWGLLSDALTDLGAYTDAAAATQHMVDLKPSLPSYSRAAYLMWLKNDFAGAKNAVRLAVDSGRDPHDPEPVSWVIVQAAQMFWQAGDYPGAIAGYDQALAVFPDFPPALAGKGQVLIAQGNPKQAAELLQRAFTQSPLMTTAWLLGDAQNAAGNRDGAEKSYALLEREGPTSDPRTLALFLATKNRDTPKAVELALAERAARDDLYTEDACAWALYRAGRLPEAATAAAKAVALGTPDAKLWYHAGAIRLAKGDPKGRALIQKALTMNPNFDATGAAEARALLAGRP
jgi:tetratricopeptide (TPR) repeat protein